MHATSVEPFIFLPSINRCEIKRYEFLIDFSMGMKCHVTHSGKNIGGVFE
jgi:hypothetical protein